MAKNHGKRSQRLKIKSAANEAKTSKAGLVEEMPSKSSKRRSSKHSDSEKTAKRHKSDDTHDGYCWNCHDKIKAKENESIYECASCPKVFHATCLRPKFVNGKCSFCHELSNYEKPEASLSKILRQVILVACPMDEDRNMKLANLSPREDTELCSSKNFGYGLIYDRIMEKDVPYKSDIELLDDIKWIMHNCAIINGKNSPDVKNVKEVLKDVTSELEEAMGCSECYFKKNDPYFYLNICERPHPIILAKMKFYPPWPAKCYKVVDGKAAFVRFFQSHDMGKIDLKQCLFMTNNFTSTEGSSNSKNVNLVMALNQVKAYIGNFEEHFKVHFPYRDPENAAFNFKEATDEIDEIVKTYRQNRSCVIESSADVVDLSESEDDNIPSRPESRNLFEDQSQFEIHETEPPNDTKETNADRVMVDNNVDNAQAFLDEICSTDSNIKEGFAAVNYEDFQAGQLLPSWPENDVDPSIGEIEISNISSGNRPNLNQNAHVSNEEESNYISRLTSDQTSFSNYDGSSSASLIIPPNPVLEDDGDCQIIDEVSTNGSNGKGYDPQRILQSILSHDPKSRIILRDAKVVIDDLFIRFWAAVGKLKSPEVIIKEKDAQIQRLESEILDLNECNKKMKKDYEQRLKNCANVLEAKMNRMQEIKTQYEDCLKAAEKNFNENIREAKDNVYQMPEERSQAPVTVPVQYSLAFQQTITQTNITTRQSVSSIGIPQQTSSAVHVVSEKKRSVEVTKTGDRSTSSDVLY